MIYRGSGAICVHQSFPKMSKPKRPRSAAARELEAADLRGRALLILAAAESEAPSAFWSQWRLLIESSTKLSDLRLIYRETRSFLGAMSPTTREPLERELRERFGPDAQQIRDGEVVAKVRSVGRIKSEREYRIVQAYLDSLLGNPDDESEFASLGELLDEFMAAPTPRAQS